MTSAQVTRTAGEATFTPGLGIHTHENTDGRLLTGALAVGLIVVVLLLCAATVLRDAKRRAVVGVLSLMLIAGGAIALIAPSSNDWYFIGVRPESARGDVMPLPGASRTYESPDLNPLPIPPYVETLRAISMPPGARSDTIAVPGPETLIVIDGSAEAHIDLTTVQLDQRAATLAQAGTTLQIVNRGSSTLHLLDFAVVPRSTLVGSGP